MKCFKSPIYPVVINDNKNDSDRKGIIWSSNFDELKVLKIGNSC